MVSKIKEIRDSSLILEEKEEVFIEDVDAVIVYTEIVRIFQEAFAKDGIEFATPTPTFYVDKTPVMSRHWPPAMQ